MQTPGSFDRHAVAVRLRELVGSRGFGRVPELAERLSLEEVDLWRAMDEESPHQRIEVLVAIVRDFGIDPTWLVTGEYSPATHRRALEEGAPGIAATIDAVIRSPKGPTSALSDLNPADPAQGFSP